MISIEEFKVYLDSVVEAAFKEGVIWKQNGSDLLTIDEAVKRAQEKILEQK